MRHYCGWFVRVFLPSVEGTTGFYSTGYAIKDLDSRDRILWKGWAATECANEIWAGQMSWIT